jgi:glycosyltransferase involved in cell wall biosynthesis
LNSSKILDVDDAIYLHGNGKFIEKIAKNCNAVICGNSFLENKFKTWNKNTIIIPTAVDTKKYILRGYKKESSRNVVIGWIGTSGGFKYIYQIEKAINYVINNFPNAEFMVVSDSKPKFEFITKYRFEKWSAEKEVKNLHEFDIGIMPLENNEWSKGKCSYKMLQYMSCGIPVVVSPVGMNNEVLAKGKIGYAATELADWKKYLEKLIINSKKRTALGQNGRKVVEENYSLETLTMTFNEFLIKTIETNKIYHK